MTDTKWPYDAPRDDPLTALRIPVTGREMGNYLVAFDRDSVERPTKGEASLIVSFSEFQRDQYGPRGQELMLARPFDWDGGYNTVLLHKYGPDSWGYRRFSWESTPFFLPDLHCGHDPMTLREVLDQAEGPHHLWSQWKTSHPDVFPEASE